MCVWVDRYRLFEEKKRNFPMKIRICRNSLSQCFQREEKHLCWITNLLIIDWFGREIFIFLFSGLLNGINHWIIELSQKKKTIYICDWNEHLLIIKKKTNEQISLKFLIFMMEYLPFLILSWVWIVNSFFFCSLIQVVVVVKPNLNKVEEKEKITN